MSIVFIFRELRRVSSQFASCAQVNAPLDIGKYIEWLWAPSGVSVSGFGQLPGIFVLVDAVLQRRSEEEELAASAAASAAVHR